MDEFTKNVERLENAIESAKGVARECNESTADLKQAIKEARAAKVEMEQLAEKLLGDYFEREMHSFIEEVKERQHDYVESILDKFDTVTKPLMESFDLATRKAHELEKRFLELEIHSHHLSNKKVDL